MVTQNNNIPFVVGADYLITPGTGSQDSWVRITNLTLLYVYAVGLDHHVADLKIPRWKFDDLVKEYKINGILYSRNDAYYNLLTQDGNPIIL